VPATTTTYLLNTEINQITILMCAIYG